MKTVAVLGAGSFGTALSVHLARAGHRVRLWARDRAFAEALELERRNAVYLPEIPLPETVSATGALDEAIGGAEMVVVAVPSHGMRGVLDRVRPILVPGAIVVSATKGLEEGTLMRMSELAGDRLGASARIVALSGPGFALDLARGLPTALVAASGDRSAAALVQEELRSKYLRLYASDDVVGVELGGALKNVIAIAAGVVEGMGIGHNALAALLTRGLVEMTRLAGAAGARRETLAGLAGLGDLVLTCTGSLSRNRRVGIELARGQSLPEIMASTKMVAEGVRTTGAALALGARHGVELPIAAQMAEVLAGQKPARAALEDLMLRPQRAESDGG
jgi:glycerol-3-phosphate dehydrogenase (NAD(P)+)